MQLINKELQYNPNTGEFIRVKGRVDKRGVAGSVYKNGYRYVTFEGARYRAHRLAFLFMEGDIPNMVDHINGDKDDNRWCNLRACTAAENNQNRHTAVRVYKTPNNTWRCRIMVDGVRVNYGSHETEELATLVCAEALENIGHITKTSVGGLICS